MAKRVYYVEYADKDMAFVLVDNGEEQAIMTSNVEVGQMQFDEYMKRGFEVVGLRSSFGGEEDSEYRKEGWRPRLWHNIETGERVPAPLGKKWDPTGVRA